MKHKKIWTAAAGAICTAAVAEWIISNNMLKVESMAVRSKKIPTEFDGFRIVQLSDLHRGLFGKDNERLLVKIQRLFPDIIVMTGDMIDDEKDNLEAFFNFSEKLALKYPVYYVPGNHELRMSEELYNKMISQLALFGIKILDNKGVVIRRRNDEIMLSGLWHDLCYYMDASKKRNEVEEFTIENMTQLLGNADKSKYNVLITHNPFCFEIYSRWGADLTLSGHVHGGMVRLPKIGGIFSPELNLFPKYQCGDYMKNGKTMIVSKGLGSGNISVRLFNRPEVTSITLKSIHNR